MALFVQGKRKVGTIAKYTTRNKALNRLQIKLPEFRYFLALKDVVPLFHLATLQNVGL